MGVRSAEGTEGRQVDEFNKLFSFCAIILAENVTASSPDTAHVTLPLLLLLLLLILPTLLSAVACLPALFVCFDFVLCVSSVQNLGFALGQMLCLLNTHRACSDTCGVPLWEVHPILQVRFTCFCVIQRISI